MYNFLVTAQVGAWDSRAYEFQRDRFCEYTLPLVKEHFGSLDETAIAELTSIPALFAYEGNTHNYRIGTLRRIQDRDTRLLIEFEFDAQLPSIPYAKIDPLRLSLDIRDRFELSRTHWAIKDEDLIGILTRAHLLPERLPMQIPVALVSAAADVIAARYTKAKIAAMFDAASVQLPGGNPSKAELCAGALAWTNRNIQNPISVLAEMLTEIMTERGSDRDRAEVLERQRRMNAALSATSLAYRRGRIVNADLTDATPLVVGERLGEGAYGEVFRATDVFGRSVAVKFMNESNRDIEVIMGHARALALANHPAVVTLYTVGSATHPESGVTMPTISMELLRGEPLDRFWRNHQLDDQRVRSWSYLLLDVIRALHAQRAFHGDLHPGNLLVTPQGLRVIDILYRPSLANLSTRSFDQHAAQDVRESRGIITSLLERSTTPAQADVFRQRASGFDVTIDDLWRALEATIGTGEP